jgi:uncharacterized protein (DUF58 family)
LLLWVAAVVLPGSLLVAFEPSALGLGVGAMSVLALVAVIDAFGARAGLAGLSVELPNIVRMSKDRPAKLEIRIRNTRQKSKTLRLALPLPREIQSAQEDALVALPPESEWAKVDWPCIPRTRGRFQVSSVYLETASPFGFWSRRKQIPARGEIRVYPNLFDERKRLSALFLHRGAFGLHAQRQVGKGREFEKLREYVPGDGYDEVHWKATARRGRPITKVFQIERTQEVYVVIDASRLSARLVDIPNQNGNSNRSRQGGVSLAPNLRVARLSSAS